MASIAKFDTWQSAAGVNRQTVLQVLQAVKTDTFTTSSSVFIDVPNLSVTITPSSATSKILIIGSVSCGATGGSEGDRLRFTRNGTVLTVGDAAGTRTQCHSMGAARDSNVIETVPMCLLDSPGTTSALTYKIQTMPYSSAYPSYINMTEGNADGSNVGNRAVSSILVMEIAG